MYFVPVTVDEMKALGITADASGNNIASTYATKAEIITYEEMS